MSPAPAAQVLGELNARAAGAPAEAILALAIRTWPSGLACACSLGLEDVVLVDMIAQGPIRPRVFLLDTGRLHEQTYETLAALRTRYRIPIEIYFPQAEAVQALVTAKGPCSFYESLENRQECCAIRKREPLGRALAGAPAWITGLRREQSPTRAEVRAFEWDAANGGLVKVNPLVDWTLAQVLDYVRSRRVPYNPLHDQGFPSIGCAPCTRAVPAGEDPRSGRWWWERPETRECGLHAHSQRKERS